MTDRPTQLVGSLHGSLYLMLIAWLALLDRVTSVTLPYYFTYTTSWTNIQITTQAVFRSTMRPNSCMQVRVSQNAEIMLAEHRAIYGTDYEGVELSNLITLGYMCPTTDTTCTAGTGIYHHSELQIILMGTVTMSGNPPTLWVFNIPDETLTQFSATGFGNINFIEWIPGTTRFILPGPNSTGITVWNYEIVNGTKQIQLVNTIASVNQYYAPMCINSTACILQTNNGTSSVSLWLVDLEQSLEDLLVSVLLASSDCTKLSLKRLTALNLFAVANGSQ